MFPWTALLTVAVVSAAVAVGVVVLVSLAVVLAPADRGRSGADDHCARVLALVRGRGGPGADRRAGCPARPGPGPVDLPCGAVRPWAIALPARTLRTDAGEELR